eukprot:5230805-Alexandrium_andersonii.AAC.1
MEASYKKVQKLLLEDTPNPEKLQPIMIAVENEMARHTVRRDSAKSMAAGLKGIKPDSKNKKGKKKTAEQQPGQPSEPALAKEGPNTAA